MVTRLLLLFTVSSMLAAERIALPNAQYPPVGCANHGELPQPSCSSSVVAGLCASGLRTTPEYTCKTCVCNAGFTGPRCGQSVYFHHGIVNSGSQRFPAPSALHSHVQEYAKFVRKLKKTPLTVFTTPVTARRRTWYSCVRLRTRLVRRQLRQQ